MIQASALSRNPALLKLDLYCKGARLDDSCFIEEDGGRKILRTRAGLGSGLELILPGGLWTNVPVTEPFAAASPYDAPPRRRAATSSATTGQDVAHRPALAAARRGTTRRPRTGKPMTRIGTLQGTYLGIYQAKVCEYWTAKPQKINCKFCSVGLNLGVDDADEKSVDEVMEVVRRGPRRVGHHLRGLQHRPLRRRHLPRHPRALPRAHQEGAGPARRLPDPAPPRPASATTRCGRWASTASPSASRSSTASSSRRSARASTPSTASTTTSRRCATARALGKKGPQARAVGHERRDHRRPRAARVVDPRDRLDHVGGRDSHGLRVPARWWAPTSRTRRRPRTEDMVPVFRRLYEACMEKGLPIGCAPNIHVSLVMLPEECRALSPRRFPCRR